MANTIILKRSSTPSKVPTTAQLDLGEIAINTYDGLLYIKKDDGTPSIVQIGGVTSVNSATGAVVLDTDDVSEGASNQYFTTVRARTSVSAGTGISYNSGTGVISTTQNLSSAGSPTFAGMTLTSDLDITGDIIPSADNVYSLGSANYMWKDVYVGPGSLYVNGQKVLEDNSGTITFSADPGQSLQIKTSGAGNVQLSTDASGVIQITSTLQIASGKNITDSAGIKVQFGDPIEMNSNKIIGLGAPTAGSDAATKTYVDTQVASISTNSISQGNSNVTVTDTGTGTVTVSVDGSTALTVSSSGVTVAGNLTVQGATTTVESNTISLADNIITLNSDATGAASQNAGVEVERGDDANVSLRWNEGTDVWQFTNDGATYYPMARSTDDLAVGSTNLYFTNTLARGAVSASSSTGISYNSGTGLFSLGSIPNSSLTNSSVTVTAGTGLSGGGTVALGGTVTLTNTITQYTDALARAAVSASGDLSYNSTTGVFSYTSPTVGNGTQTVTAGTGLTGGGSFTANQTGDSSVTLSLDGTGTIGAGTYGSTSVATKIAQITVDAYGRITAITTGATGDIQGVTAGNGLTGGGTSGTVTLAVGAGAYIIANAADIAVDATDANTASKVVARDASGNFSAGTITANLTGNVTGNVTGNATTATSATSATNATNAANVATIATATNANHYLTFVNSNNGTSANELLYTDAGVYYNPSSNAFFVAGEVTAYASDAQLKTNVVAIESPLAKVEAMRGVTYNWNELGQGLGLGTEQQVGVIAQEVEAVLPQLVVQSAHEGYKTVKYDKLTAVLIEAVKELSAKVKTLEARLGDQSL